MTHATVRAGLAGFLSLLCTSALAAPANAWIAAASPSQENHVPTVAGTPTCIATFRLNGTDEIVYRIRCFNITGVNAAHIHSGNADIASGAVRVTLFSGSPTGAVNGILASGSIERGITLSPAAYDQLVADMRADATYFNAHTTANSAGEVRGAIVGFTVPKTPNLPF
ncbi:MAG TPA: CHRD domain-containing protein [Methylibium sp.]|nr:CHRD domain-containing protein [Methylibium sp.]